MNILVCIKQVPDTTKVAIDPITGSLIRSGAAARMNPYDLYSLEAALRLKDTEGARIDIRALVCRLKSSAITPHWKASFVCICAMPKSCF